jgi:uroporphyrinogen decarboxylase
MSTAGFQVQRGGNRRRLRAALERQFTGEVPFWENFVAASVVDQVMGRPLGANVPHLAPAEYVEFLQRTGMDAAYLGVDWPLGRKHRNDRQGRAHYVDGTIKSRADFDQIVLPPIDEAERRLEGFLAAAAHTELGAAWALMTSVTEVFTAIGPEDSLLALYDDPDFVQEFMDRVEEYTLPLVERVVQYPLDAIWVTGLQCANKGPIMSREMHAEFVFPRLEKIMRIIRPFGIPVILHSDGDNSLLMEWIVQAGFAAIHPVEPGIGNFDIYKLKVEYGDRIAVCGNIDVGSVLSRGTPAEVRADVLEHIRRLAPGGGYVCGSSHDITENIPFENFCALAQTACSTRMIQDGSIVDPAVPQ